MNVNLCLKGELENFINELVRRGIAANKTEAIRLAITRYYETQQTKKINSEPIELAASEAWNNPSDEKSSDFYRKRYLNEKA
jgi:Arc/MetJ-type ribon-helix-helix transcriptional regulator